MWRLNPKRSIKHDNFSNMFFLNNQGTTNDYVGSMIKDFPALEGWSKASIPYCAHSQRIMDEPNGEILSDVIVQ